MARAKRHKAGLGAWLLRLLALLLLLAMLGGGYLWWRGLYWTPDASVYPDQGALVDETAPDTNFRTLRALGASFVYLAASDGGNGKDASFARHFELAREAHMQVGVVHRFDPCATADVQSANFVTMVPRSADLLPPAIELTRTAEDCPRRTSEAAVESELLTLINQIEIHTGRPVLLKPSRAFERTYGIASRIERNLWLTQSWAEPDYGGRPWLLWTANTRFNSKASEHQIGWVVVQP